MVQSTFRGDPPCSPRQQDHPASSPIQVQVYTAAFLPTTGLLLLFPARGLCPRSSLTPLSSLRSLLKGTPPREALSVVTSQWLPAPLPCPSHCAHEWLTSRPILMVAVCLTHSLPWNAHSVAPLSTLRSPHLEQPLAHAGASFTLAP